MAKLTWLHNGHMVGEVDISQGFLHLAQTQLDIFNPFCLVAMYIILGKGALPIPPEVAIVTVDFIQSYWTFLVEIDSYLFVEKIDHRNVDQDSHNSSNLKH